MQQFLNVIARGYRKKYSDISRLTFVMPNKRSGSFLLKQFHSMSGQSEISPRIVAISDFIADNIPLVTDSRLDLLFRLYRCYASLSGSAETVTFENFYSWGETLLADFNEIDMQMVDVETLFKNVEDLNSIKSDFLTDEQKEVMIEYFGYSPEILQESGQRLWKTFHKDGGHGGEERLKQKFLNLWQILLPLYRNFKDELRESGLTTNGGAYRLAAELMESGKEPYPGEKIVFVGFNALSESERRIFSALKEMTFNIGEGEERKADFVWDMISPVFAEDDDPAVKFIRINSRTGNFPPPGWLKTSLEASVPANPPKIEVISVPSNVMQVKVASEELLKIASSISEESIQDARVAVILPDENLLLPLLYSLPEEYSNPNLTMGFPLRQTSVISYAGLIRKLHRRSRISEDGEASFFFEDVRDILGHPYSYILFDKEKIRTLIQFAERRKLIMVPLCELEALGDKTTLVFKYLNPNFTPRDVVVYIYRIMQNVRERISEKNDTYLRSKIEKTYIDTYLDALMRLAGCFDEFMIPLSPEAVFMLADRLIAGETVAFEGEPLEGLQVMGVLETRCLDFDRIIMLSVNEKIMPRVGRTSTFIPNVVRCAFGMPPARYQEEIFAYYFFRILGRCEQGILTYDSRSANVRTVGPSRYLLQMKYLPGRISLSEREARFGMPVTEGKELSVNKEGGILEKLKGFNINEKCADPKDIRKFSATALAHYFECQLRFLYNDVLKIYVEREKIESIDAIDMGTIVHNVIEHLYIQDESLRHKMLSSPIVMTEEKLRNLLTATTEDGQPLIEQEIKDAILEVHFGIEDEALRRKEKLRGSAAILQEDIAGYIRNIIRTDISQAPFRIWGCEIKKEIPYTLSDGKTVILKVVIDRLDQSGDSEPDRPFRIIDYKTGSVHLNAPTFADIFTGNYSSKNLFQLLFYARLLILLVERKEIRFPEGLDFETFSKNLQIAIYNVPEIHDLKGISTPKIDGQRIKSMADLAEAEIRAGETFTAKLDEKIEEILNPEVPFAVSPSDDLCRYCDYRLRCSLMS